MTDTAHDDTHVKTPYGRLFVRRWQGARTDQAAPIILFHDSLGSVEQWRDFPAQLGKATGRSVLAYDRLGFGRSDPNPDTLKPDFVGAEALRALAHIRDKFAIDRMVLLGHSVGGGMAVASGAAFPAATEAVITLAAQAFVEDRTIAGIEAAKAAFQREGQLDRLARFHGGKARWVLDAWTETWLSSAFANWTLYESLRRLACPLLALHGDHDEYGSRAHPDRIAALATGPARAVLLENCHHMPHREKPDDVLRLISGFLKN